MLLVEVATFDGVVGYHFSCYGITAERGAAVADPSEPCFMKRVKNNNPCL